MLQPVHSIKSHVTRALYAITCYNQCTLCNHMLHPVHSNQSQVTTSAQYPITCYNQCTVFYHMLQPVYSTQSHITTSAQYPITCTNIHTYPRRTAKPQYVSVPSTHQHTTPTDSSLYTTAHHTN